MLLKVSLQEKLMSLTSCKFFGSYYHSLVKHAPEQYRLFSGKTPKTEKEEVIINALIRLECRDLVKNYPLSNQESKITKLYVEIKKNLQNTFFTFKRIENDKCQYEYFLKLIADKSCRWWYLVERK